MSKQGLHESRPHMQSSVLLQVPAAELARLSVSALLLAGVSVGCSRLAGLAASADVDAAMSALEEMGVVIKRRADGWWVTGAGNGGLLAPQVPLDFRDAGLALCLTAGLVSAYDFPVSFDGPPTVDERLLAPLAAMGVQVDQGSAETGMSIDRIVLHGPRATAPIAWSLKSADVSVAIALLLAGLNTPGRTSVRVPDAAFAHLIRLLQAFGVDGAISSSDGSGMEEISVVGRARLLAAEIELRGV